MAGLNVQIIDLGYTNDEPDVTVRCVGCAETMDPFGGQEFKNVVHFPDGATTYTGVEVGLCQSCGQELLLKLKDHPAFK